jgi:hypothetical protein
MGGPVALTALRRVGPDCESDFAGFVAIATSSYWVRPRHQMMVAAAPYAMAQGSPILMRAHRAEIRRAPDQARRIAWEYAVRPPRRILEEAAAELRRFDARRWDNLSLPPAVWIVTRHDGIIDPADQTASAQKLGIPTVDLPNDHPVVVQAPAALVKIIEEASSVWSRNRPIHIRRRMQSPEHSLGPNGSVQEV